MCKKIIIASLFVCFLLTSSLVFIASTNDNSYIEIEIESHGLSQEKIDFIRKKIMNSDYSNHVSTANILCIFGHDILSGTAIKTSHNYYPDDPKCLKTSYTYEVCTRDGCDYYTATEYSWIRVVCH